MSNSINSICPNYDRILHFDYLEDDRITSKLIEIYKTYLKRVSLNSEELKELKQYDYVLGRYLDDYTFRKELKSEIVHIQIKKTCGDILRAIVESVIKIFDNYLENSTRKITIARWIWFIKNKEKTLAFLFLFCYNEFVSWRDSSAG